VLDVGVLDRSDTTIDHLEPFQTELPR
jgi:hypothetical protein